MHFRFYNESWVVFVFTHAVFVKKILKSSI